MVPLKLKILFITFSNLLLSFFSLGQVNANSAFQKVLRRAEVGREISFDKSKPKDCDSLVLVYLGEIHCTHGKKIRILTSRWYWGFAPRATSRIIVFNEKNQYLGDYYMTMTCDVPDKIETGSLVFSGKKQCDCTPGRVTKINFTNGIPKSFFVPCQGKLGDIRSFEQNL